MSDELPKNWATAPLDSLCQKFRGVSYGHHEVSSVPKKGSVPILRANNLQNDRLVFDELVWVSSGCVNDQQKLRTGDIVIAMSSGSKSVVGKTAQVMEDWQGSFGAFCGVLRPWPELNSRYVGLFLRTREYRSTISELAAGSNINNLKNEHLASIEVPVAPLREQQRIVAKLETLLDKVDASQQRLVKIPVLLKRFRQSILNAAITGQLTTDWRNNGERGCDAKAELESLLAAAKSHRPKTREAEPTEGHETLTDEVPPAWATPSLDDLFRFIDYRGKTPKKSASGKRLISAKNIKTGYISEEPVEYVSDEFYRTWMTRGFPKIGDIFFVTEGHTMGFTALNNRTDEFALSQRTITLQPWQPIETPCFFYFIMSRLFQDLVMLNATGSAAVGIKAAKFRGLPIPFPSRAEQQEIVRRVEGLFGLADQLELRLANARGQVDKLTSSLLARAFAGKLVPQVPNDEPASVLLEQIRKTAKNEESERKGKGAALENTELTN